MAYSQFSDILKIKYVLEVMCPKCGKKRIGKTTNINGYHFDCFVCGKRTTLRSSKGDNCKFKVLYKTR